MYNLKKQLTYHISSGNIRRLLEKEDIARRFRADVAPVLEVKVKNISEWNFKSKPDRFDVL